ncbi:MarR family winged helix-turn-helix transcriptional regulator [Acidicapsa ligni]|uniref:MarR family winged helix-turn-helix transcriptional regulator n=1 Tax=Acidicapsa ligni TaxID=542300 RepID=UPI0021E06A8E|nr:MarR family transcriptional regulator [Acidicapsa ligni]
MSSGLPETERAASSASPGFSSPQEEALLTLMRSADCLHRTLQQRLKPYGLTSTQYNVLRILRGARSTGLTCSAIGQRMITPEPDITRLLARLKLQKLISQQRDQKDRRVLWTHITDLGLELLSKLSDVIDQAPKELFQNLNSEELRSFIRLLNKVQACSERTVAASDSAGNRPPVTGKPSSRHLQPNPLLPRPHPE